MDSITVLKDWSIQPISREEERRLLRKAKRGCQQSRETLVRSLVRFAINQGKYHSGKGYTLEDYTQFGVMAILEGIDTFKMKHKTRLTTHVGWIMKRVILEARRKGEIIRCPNKREPKIMVEIYDVPAKEQPEEKVRADQLWFMNHLTDRERSVVERFLKGETLKEVGERFGIVRERVRQIQVKLFRRIRDAESRSTNDTERGRIFVESARRARSGPKKSRKDHVLSRQEQVDQCFENRGYRANPNRVPLNTTSAVTGRFGL